MIKHVKRQAMLIGMLYLVALNISWAIPTVSDGYTVDLYASGIGAVTAVTLGADGALYAADYTGGRILRIDGQNSVTQISSGLQYITGLAFTSDGRFYAEHSGTAPGRIVEVHADGSYSTLASGFSFPTSMEAWGNELFISNSGDGTISRVSQSGSVETFISGLSAPNGPFGISFDADGNMYFIDHGTGMVYSADQAGNLTAIDTVTALGGTYTGIGFGSRLFVSDVNTGQLLFINDVGQFDVFASGFTGKSSAPVIGPNDFIYDGMGHLYVGDGDNIWRISVAVPEPSTLALLLMGMMALGLAANKWDSGH
jgi:sugar lactone lactonase YvrE